MGWLGNPTRLSTPNKAINSRMSALWTSDPRSEDTTLGILLDLNTHVKNARLNLGLVSRWNGSIRDALIALHL